GDRFFWFTTTGWMMWNFLVSGPAVGTAVVMFDGNPAARAQDPAARAQDPAARAQDPAARAREPASPAHGPAGRAHAATATAAEPDLGVLWRLAAEAGVTYFGTSAPFLLACRKAG